MSTRRKPAELHFEISVLQGNVARLTAANERYAKSFADAIIERNTARAERDILLEAFRLLGRDARFDKAHATVIDLHAPLFDKLAEGGGQ